MKGSFSAGIKKSGIILILSVLIIPCTIQRVYAQGWIFTATTTISGPCGAYAPPLPSFTITYMPTQSQCESLRQSILAIRSDMPMYDEHGNYIGDCSAYFVCSPCTGSDMSGTTGATEPGSVSIDGVAYGNPFFSPHETRNLEYWMEDYLVKARSMGITPEIYNSLLSQDIPLTGDPVFDKGYADRIVRFEKPEQGGVVDLSGKAGIVDLNAVGEKPVETPLIQNNELEQSTVSVTPSYVPALETIDNNRISDDGHPVIESIQDVSKMVVDIYAPGWTGLGLKAGINLLAEDAKALQDVYNGKPCPSTSTIIANALKTTAEDGIQDLVDNKALSVSKYIGVKSGIKPINIANAVKTYEWGKVAKDGAENGYNLGSEIAK